MRENYSQDTQIFCQLNPVFILLSASGRTFDYTSEIT